MSAWGSSWGSAWGSSWGATATYDWRIPTNAANGTERYVLILADNTLTVLDSGTATAAGGFFRFAVNISVSDGDVRFAFVHNWDGGVKPTASTYGGAAFATVVEQ
jgi:hypothetical protein